jgi:hypothetical protein
MLSIDKGTPGFFGILAWHRRAERDNGVAARLLDALQIVVCPVPKQYLSVAELWLKGNGARSVLRIH